jgi:RHS repeat-associated protein
VYGHDNAGDRTAETSPETEKRTLGYNEDSQEIWTVSPRGNAGGELTKYMTGIERDEQGRPLKIADPLGHTIKYTYDADGNLETITDGNGHKTIYTYNADDEPTKVKEPNGTVTETEYDGAGNVTAQVDGNKHTTKYVRNALGEVTEVIDPLSRKTTKEYDAAGNLTTLTDPLGRTTTYVYDPANRLKEVTYSDGKTHSVKYEYNADGDRTSVIDGTGTTSYTYDKLDRLTEVGEPHGLNTSYEYNLANQQTKITYPSGKAVSRAYDKDGRLQKVTDFAEHATTFSYDKDSDLTATIFPSGSKGEDTYAYNTADQMTEAKVGATEKDTITYARDGDGQVSASTEKGLPGEEHHTDTYDEDNRLLKAGSDHEWEYDATGQPTKIWTVALAYDADGEIQTKYGYTYNEAGERTRYAPTKGPATTYTYDQAGNLTAVNRSAEGSIRLINDTYAYNGDGLRTAEASSTGGTKYMAWDNTQPTPVLIYDGKNSYIYGPEDLPIEEVNTEGRALYLHHDQQGSTRLITNSTGAKEAAYTYGPYGELIASAGTATTALGYDGQYTNSDTGLIYLRAREYDPATAQFLSRDPLTGVSGEPYIYAADNPVNVGDPSGLLFGIELPSLEEVGEGIAGWGDTITLGATNWAREELGINNINACSGAYQTGGFAGLVTGVLIPGEGEVEVGVEGLDETLAGLRESKANIYEVDSAEELQALYDELSRGGEPATPEGYNGEMVKLPDGTRVGLRNTSGSGGPTIDIHQPGQPVVKVHLPNG